MTDHYEDFDASKFGRYVQEVKALNEGQGVVLIPGLEVNLHGIDTIVFPTWDYAEVARFAAGGETGMFKVVAHPSKYPFDKIARHAEKYRIDGVELWNQQADGRYLPPVGFLDSLRPQAWRDQSCYFFGCDLHDVNLTVTNFISLPRPPRLTADAIVREVIAGRFGAGNLTSGIEYRNGPERTDFDTWLATLLSKPYYRGRIQQGLRRCLKGFYRMLPRDTQHSLNDIKNFVRNKI